ncbi:MAG: choice-of-anchor tandem repeat GloVer-containing protein [Bacteroidia bacterium]
MPYGDLYYDGTYLYGMTYGGGANGYGTIFKIKPDGTGYIKILDFAGSSNGQSPDGSLISDGTFLYGMTNIGGTNNNGTIFKIMPNGTGYVKLLYFAYTPTGSQPYGSLIYDGTYLYGTTALGGINGNGTIFKIKTDGTGYLKLLDFGYTNTGSESEGNLFYDGTFLYGMTYGGGTHGDGNIFKIKPDGSNFDTLMNFKMATSGRQPNGALISDGIYLYGMTPSGGANSMGTIFKILPNGTGYVKLLDFSGTSNGQGPFGSLIYDGAFLYGMTGYGGINNDGIIFKIKPDGSGFVKLFDFGGATNGQYSRGSIISDGTTLYGMTLMGGTNGDGVVFKLAGAIGIEQVSEKNNQLKIYPNPNNGSFVIEPNSSAKQTMQVYDVNGKMVLSQTINGKTSIDASCLNEGVYNISLISNEGVVNKRVVIVR